MAVPSSRLPILRSMTACSTTGVVERHRHLRERLAGECHQPDPVGRAPADEAHRLPLGHREPVGGCEVFGEHAARDVDGDDDGDAFLLHLHGVAADTGAGRRDDQRGEGQGPERRRKRHPPVTHCRGRGNADVAVARGRRVAPPAQPPPDHESQRAAAGARDARSSLRTPPSGASRARSAARARSTTSGDGSMPNRASSSDRKQSPSSRAASRAARPRAVQGASAVSSPRWADGVRSRDRRPEAGRHRGRGRSRLTRVCPSPERWMSP